MSYFANKLIQLRKNAGLTQDQVAQRLEISRSSVAMYEAGSREPDFEMLESIADLFNIDMRDLVGSSSENNDDANPLSGASVIKKQFVDSVLKLSDQDVVYLQQMLDLFLSTKK